MTETEPGIMATLDQLRVEHPGFEIWNGYIRPGCWVWFARGADGSPWLIMSANLGRFRRWLAEGERPRT